MDGHHLQVDVQRRACRSLNWLGRGERCEILAIGELLEQAMGRKWDVPDREGSKRDWRGGVDSIRDNEMIEQWKPMLNGGIVSRSIVEDIGQIEQIGIGKIKFLFFCRFLIFINFCYAYKW